MGRLSIHDTPIRVVPMGLELAGAPKDEWWGRKWPFSACFEEGFAVALHASGF